MASLTDHPDLDCFLPPCLITVWTVLMAAPDDEIVALSRLIEKSERAHIFDLFISYTPNSTK